jgi:dolichol-phosphate mannosyltransferase
MARGYSILKVSKAFFPIRIFSVAPKGRADEALDFTRKSRRFYPWTRSPKLPPMLISLIIPVLNEAENLPHCWERINGLVAALPEFTFETIFVDDGSTDSTVAVVKSLPAGPRASIRLVKLSRNFGHQGAICAGMAYAKGEALIFLDADLQDPPELISVFLEKFQEGYDVVYAVRQNRKESWLHRVCFNLFYKLFNAMAERPIPLDSGDFGLMSRRVAKLVQAMPEQDRFVRGLRSWVGFKQIGIPYDRPERLRGESQYNFSKRLRFALDGIFSFSRLPMRVALGVGMLTVFVSFVYLVGSCILALFFHVELLRGWTSIVTLIFLAAGANIVATSVVGEYAVRIYFQTKERPLFIVDEVADCVDANSTHLVGPESRPETPATQFIVPEARPTQITVPRGQPEIRSRG